MGVQRRVFELVLEILGKTAFFSGDYVLPENYDDRVRPGRVVEVRLPGSGRTIEAVVSEPPLNANSVPGGLSDTILSGRRGIVVFLKPNERLLPEESVNGMPVRVDWGIRFFR